MVEFRLVKQEEMHEAISLADRIFRDSEHSSMETAFPAVFSSSLGQSYGAFEDGRLVSFMGAVPSVIHIGSARLLVYSIGAVCTDPEGRGKGYASRLLNLVMKQADEANASLMLVSGGLAIYRKAGCEDYGSMLQFELQEEHVQDAVQENRPITLREVQPTDWLQITGLAQGRTVRYEQSVTDIAMLHQAEAVASCYKLKHKLVVAEKEDGKLGAFAIVAVPDERHSEAVPFIVERGGSPELMHDLFKHAIQAYKLKKLRVPVMWHDTEMEAVLSSYPVSTSGNSGTICVLNAQRLYEQLAPYRSARGDAKPGITIEWLPNNGCRLTDTDGEVYTLSAQEMISLWFDPEAKAVNELVRERFSAHFCAPLPYASGLNFV